MHVMFPKLGLFVVFSVFSFVGCRGLAPEAATMVGQAFRDCVNQDVEALWAVASEGFRESGRQEAETYCQVLSETVGDFERIDNVASVDRQVNLGGDFLTLTLNTSFAVGSVDASAIVIKQDGEWRLQGFEMMLDEAPELAPDVDELSSLASAHAGIFARGDYLGFYEVFGVELKEVRTAEELDQGLSGFLAQYGVSEVVDEVIVEVAGLEHRVTVPLLYEGGRSSIALSYHWRGAAWTLNSYDISVPAQTAPNTPLPGGKP